MTDDRKIDDRLRELCEMAEHDASPSDLPARVADILARRRHQHKHILLAAAVLGGALALPNLWPAMIVVAGRMMLTDAARPFAWLVVAAMCFVCVEALFTLKGRDVAPLSRLR